MDFDFQQIIVEEVSVKDEITGSGATQELSPEPDVSLGSNIDSNQIAETINSLADLANIRTDRFKMTYKMRMFAPTGRAARRRARAFARAKNPFEPRMYIVSDARKRAGVNNSEGLQPMYSVDVTVFKR